MGIPSTGCGNGRHVLTKDQSNWKKAFRDALKMQRTQVRLQNVITGHGIHLGLEGHFRRQLINGSHDDRPVSPHPVTGATEQDGLVCVSEGSNGYSEPGAKRRSI